MRPRRRRAGTGPLSERQVFVLRYLLANGETAPGAEAGNHWRVPNRTVYAFQISDALNFAARESGNYSHRNAHTPGGIANTLSALRRRKLAENDGGGVFLQAKWWITPAGVEYLRALDPGSVPR